MARPSLLSQCVMSCFALYACGSDTDASSAAQPTMSQSGSTAVATPSGSGAGAPSSIMVKAPSGAPTPVAGSISMQPTAASAGTSAAAGSNAGTLTMAGSSADAAAVGGGSGGAAGALAMAGSSGSAGMQTAQPCSDMCPVKDGVPLACKLRFMYGLNYAWHTFAADFGGISAWNQPGVSAEPAVETELAAMAASGVQSLRWWLWPDFRGDGVLFDASDTPMGLGGTALADVNRALELAEKYDLYLMLTIFSFDNFRATRMESTLKVRGIAPIVLDNAKRRALMDNVVAPLARAVASSPHAKRVIAWDMINEPEWAISGASLYGGDPKFDPQTDLESVSHAQMEMFLRDTFQTLRANSQALITVGGSAIKWKSAWSKLELDFHQFHMYDWVNMSWPYDRNPMSYGLDDKPVVMGEFPLTGLMGVSYTKLLESWFGNKYAGAMGWAYTDPMFSGNRNLSEVKAFSGAHACETRY